MFEGSNKLTSDTSLHLIYHLWFYVWWYLFKISCQNVILQVLYLLIFQNTQFPLCLYMHQHQGNFQLYEECEFWIGTMIERVSALNYSINVFPVLHNLHTSSVAFSLVIRMLACVKRILLKINWTCHPWELHSYLLCTPWCISLF